MPFSLLAAPVAEGEEEEDLPLSLLRRSWTGWRGECLDEIAKLRSLRAAVGHHCYFKDTHQAGGTLATTHYRFSLLVN
jgi:hypothetical protein